LNCNFARGCKHLATDFFYLCNNIAAVYVLLVMALYQRKPRHGDSENMVIFQDNAISENAENFAGRKAKTVLTTSRPPLQDCTTKIHILKNAKQVTRVTVKVLESTAFLL